MYTYNYAKVLYCATCFEIIIKKKFKKYLITIKTNLRE